MKLLGISGAARSGKDEAAQALINRGWLPMRFAEPVRKGLVAVNPWIDVHELARLLPWPARWMFPRRWVRLADAVKRYGWEELKRLPEVRRLLQVYGTEAGRDIHGRHCWVKAVARHMRHVDTVFCDVRFPEEVEFIREHGGYVIRIVRPVNATQLEGSLAQHSSETSLGPQHWDRVLVNDSTVHDMQLSVRQLTKELFDA